MASQKDCLKVVMFPWLAHGHISPFLELAKTLSERNFLCYIISTPVNFSSIKNKIPEIYSPTIHLLDLHLPVLPELPPHHHTTNGLPIELHPTLRKALRGAEPEFSDLVRALQPDLLIHDILQPWARSVAARLDIPSVSFFTGGTVAFSYYLHLGMHPGDDFPFPAIQLDKFELSMMMAAAPDTTEEKDLDGEAFWAEDGTMLLNTSREMEGKCMDYLSTMIAKEIVPVGGLIRDPKTDGGVSVIIEWLGSKDELSTVFVSFGSEYFLSRDEIEEVACGLELSGVNFIWVLRFPKGEEVGAAGEALPERFTERIGERGRIVEKWAPQAEILRHRSVGGFVSHCGWNSLRESIDCGVPIIAVPMHLDQPVNAKLVAELGVGAEVRRDGKGRIKREEISRVIRDVVVGRKAEELRKRVGEQRERIRFTSRDEVEEVARKLTEICVKGKATVTLV